MRGFTRSLILISSHKPLVKLLSGAADIKYRRFMSNYELQFQQGAFSVYLLK